VAVDDAPDVREPDAGAFELVVSPTVRRAAPISILASGRCFVNFRAFEIKFTSTCRNIAGSPDTSGNGCIVQEIVRPCKSRRKS
jgi:hypothetical protein